MTWDLGDLGSGGTAAISVKDGMLDTVAVIEQLSTLRSTLFYNKGSPYVTAADLQAGP